MKYIARIRKKSHPKKAGRVLRKLGTCDNLVSAWERAKALFPEDEVISVQASKRSKENQMSH